MGRKQKRRSTSETSDMSNMATPPGSAQSTPCAKVTHNNQDTVIQLDYQQAMGQLDQQFTNSQAMSTQIPAQQMSAFMAIVTQKLDSVMSVNDTIMKRLNTLDAMDSTLEKINEKMQHMDTSVSSLKKDLHGTNVTMSELEKGVNFAKFIDGAKEASQKLEREVKELRNEIKHVRGDRERMHEDILDVQVRSMQDNLLFFGMNEQDNENPMSAVLNFCGAELGISGAGTSIKLERAHRLGPRRPHKNRPLVAKFSFYQQREEVRKNAYKLRGSNYGISEQFPKEVQERRRRLMTAFHDARRQNKRAQLVRDRLYVDGREVVLDEQGHT
jgi:chromosome segregation ATPase